MSPLAPYKWERSAKARARQAFSTMHWTPFKTFLSKSVIWCKLTPFKTPVHSYVETIPLSWLLSKPLCKFTHFKTLGLYTALNCSNWLLSRPKHSLWETTFKLTVLNLLWRLPSTKSVISGQFYTVHPGLISRPLHHFDSVLILHGRLPWKK